MNNQPRFLCDGMLGQLCRYLRAAGYDTLYKNNGEADRDLLRQEQNRHFLTCDRLISEHKAAQNVALVLPQDDLDQLASFVGKHFQLDWLSHAFTRCMEDNTLLLAADAAALQRIPSDARREGEAFSYCPACARVYWQGSHYKRILARLMQWQAAQTNSK
jgi:uncharacterized protein with PIN domain